MTKSYFLDLRERVVRFVEAGHSRHFAAKHFGVSVSFAVNLMSAYLTTGSVWPKPEGGWRFSKLDPHRDVLLARVAQKADITLPVLDGEQALLGTKVAPSSISHWFWRNGYRYKKTLLASEHNRPGVKLARQTWMGSRQPLRRQSIHKLVFIDEP